jgi:hypothetical protein
LSGRYRARFGILFLVCFLNLADRTVFSVVAPMIRVELKLSDISRHAAGLAFALLYGGLAPVGWLAERYETAYASSRWPRRSGGYGAVGIIPASPPCAHARRRGHGQASYAPTSSLVADTSRAHRRASVSLIMLGLPLAPWSALCWRA